MSRKKSDPTRLLQPVAPPAGVLRFLRSPFGLNPIDEFDLAEYLRCARALLPVLESQAMPSSTPENVRLFASMHHAFARLYTQSRDDWWSLSRFMGHPSATLSLEISRTFTDAKRAVLAEEEEAFARALGCLDSHYVPDMLDNLIRLALHHEKPEEEYGWAFIGWSAARPERLFVSASTGTLEDGLREVSEGRRTRCGVLGAWLVHDPVSALDEVLEAFEPWAVGEGRQYKIDLGQARRRLESILATSGNLVHSPWHSGDEVVMIKPASLSLVSAVATR